MIDAVTSKVFYGRANHVMSYGQPTTPTKIPGDSDGAALGSDDMWPMNNHAQRNVSKFEAK